MTDLIEVAIYCQKIFSDRCASENNCKYLKTMFVAIMDDDTVRVSYTPHILRNAVKCILVHSKSKLAFTNWYTWYFVQFIDENYAVHDEMLEDNFTLSVVATGTYSNQIMELSRGIRCIYCCSEPFDNKMSEIWHLYIECKKLKTEEEISLFSESICKGKEIEDLKKEMEENRIIDSINKDRIQKYESLLNDLKEVMKNIKTILK